jgi:2,5-diketo-D-gluconate reductase A
MVALCIKLLMVWMGVSASVPNVTIAPNVHMPMIAFGTAKTSLTTCSVQEGIEQWLSLGGRHIDTADDYGTQPDVGRALKTAGLPRAEVFITTKIPGPIGKQAVIDKIINTALPQLGVEYIDLVLIHFPCKLPAFTGCGKDQEEERKSTWEGLAQLRSQGRIRAVGVSNFDSEQVDAIKSAFGEAPAVNQVQFHLAYHNETLLQRMKQIGTVLEAWAPLGGPTVHGKTPTISLADDRLKSVATRYNVSTAQVVLRWETQKGVVPVTASCTKAHVAGDLASFALTLSDADLHYLDLLMPSGRIIV